MDRTLRISRSLLDAIIGEARGSADEVCGLLLGSNDAVSEIRSCSNIHPTPATRFELDPVALFAVLRAARAGIPGVLGHYHSHPSGRAFPSVTDAADAAADGALWLIVAGDDATVWEAVRDGAVHGRFDPVALAIAR